MNGLQILTLSRGGPLEYLPKYNLVGANIALKMTGGVGDCLVALASSAKTLNSLGANCTAVVRPHQISLMSEVIGIRKCVETQKFNALSVRNEFDVVIDFKGVFNNSQELIDEEYYSAVEKRLGIPIEVGEFKFKGEMQDDLIVLHPGASNPNRRWNDPSWKNLAYALRDRGFKIQWLGTRDEFGFNDSGISKISDVYHDLKKQAIIVSTARMFVGCDSGFAHVAGMLGIPGVVLFGNTSPKNVIARYPSLTSVCGTLKPTRSLKVGCLKSEAAMGRIRPEAVLIALKVRDMPSTEGPVMTRQADLFKVEVSGEVPRTILEALKQRYDVRDIRDSETPIDWSPDALLGVSCGTCKLTISGRTVGVPLNAEYIVRAIRELYQLSEHDA